jgi:hypothetical protein
MNPLVSAASVIAAGLAVGLASIGPGVGSNREFFFFLYQIHNQSITSLTFLLHHEFIIFNLLFHSLKSQSLLALLYSR